MKQQKTAPKKPEPAKVLDLSIAFKDFGPISRGTITLKPLTVLIGANNAGKSYAAMLVHAVLKTWHEAADFTLQGTIFDAVETFPDGLDKSFPGIKESLLSSKKEDFEMPPEVVAQIYREILLLTYEDESYQKIFGQSDTESALSQQLKHAYACPLQELIRTGRRAFELNITSQGHSVHLKSQQNRAQCLLKITIYPAWDAQIREIAEAIEHEVKQPRLAVRLAKEGDLTRQHLMEVMLFDHFTGIMQNLMIRSYYLPAARSGIMQGYKAIMANLIQRTSYRGKADELRFSGGIADFLSTLLEQSQVVSVPRWLTGETDLVGDIEGELLHGEIVMSSGSGHGVHLPEIYYYQDNKFNIPLYRTSSTISELAPLFVYLKQIIRPGEMLIIEEPEAHLHPANQRLLAKLLVRLIRHGVYVLITTHSEFLLEQLNSFLQLSKITPLRRSERYHYDKEDYLTSAEVAAYVFKYDAKSKGHLISEIDVTAEDGISEEEFTAVAEALYDETVQLHREVSEMAG